MSDTEPIDGQLPEGWEISTIGDVASFVRGVTYKKSEAREAAESGFIPLLRATNISSEVVSFNEYVYVPRSGVKGEQLLRQNDLVIATSSGSSSIVGKSAPILTNFEGTFGAFCAVLRPSSEVAPRYVHLFAQSPNVRDIWSNLARGTNINNLKSEQVLSTLIPLAPLAEQERIVEILEEQLSRLDAALESVRVVREKAAQFRRSLLHAAFTGTLTGHIPANGQLPEGWDVSPIGNHATISTGKIDVNASVVDGQFPFFTCARETYRIDVAPYEGKAVLVAGNGDLNVKYFEGKFNAYQRTYFLFSKNEESLLPKYLFHFLQNYVHHLRTVAIGTTIKYIKLGDLRDAPLSVPPLTEQEQIVAILEEQLSRLDAALAVADAIEKRSAALRRSLLHAAFTGRLTEQWRELSYV